eukprot:SAG22_NODE_1951_length_3269_cov_3.468139_2_plen_172_part_00
MLRGGEQSHLRECRDRELPATAVLRALHGAVQPELVPVCPGLHRRAELQPAAVRELLCPDQPPRPAARPERRLHHLHSPALRQRHCRGLAAAAAAVAAATAVLAAHNQLRREQALQHKPPVVHQRLAAHPGVRRRQELTQLRRVAVPVREDCDQPLRQPPATAEPHGKAMS